MQETGRGVASVFGRREDQARLVLRAVLAPLDMRRFYTEGWGASPRYPAPTHQVVGKELAQPQEQKHLTLRSQRKRLVRKTICFTTSEAMHELMIGLFINRFEFGLKVSIEGIH